MAVETLVYSSFHHLMKLLVQEHFIELTQKFSVRPLGQLGRPAFVSITNSGEKLSFYLLAFTETKSVVTEQ
jgi:hypothetical protein